MNYVLGKTYTVRKTDGTEITFLVVGGSPECGIVNGQRVTMDEIFAGGYTDVWEVKESA